MVVSTTHSLTAPSLSSSLNPVVAFTNTYFGPSSWHLDSTQRTIKTHWHAHFRSENSLFPQTTQKIPKGISAKVVNLDKNAEEEVRQVVKRDLGKDVGEVVRVDEGGPREGMVQVALVKMASVVLWVGKGRVEVKVFDEHGKLIKFHHSIQDNLKILKAKI
mmetsp:Transcript_39757/g.45634  ORF Transcript_39757/g.45634 Transcript_39757/m.45634 type:complete len:161 (+) Transcript_39757:626-1108(+)